MSNTPPAPGVGNEADGNEILTKITFNLDLHNPVDDRDVCATLFEVIRLSLLRGIITAEVEVDVDEIINLADAKDAGSQKTAGMLLDACKKVVDAYESLNKEAVQPPEEGGQKKGKKKKAAAKFHLPMWANDQEMQARFAAAKKIADNLADCGVKPVPGEELVYEIESEPEAEAPGVSEQTKLPDPKLLDRLRGLMQGESAALNRMFAAHQSVPSNGQPAAPRALKAAPTQPSPSPNPTEPPKAPETANTAKEFLADVPGYKPAGDPFEIALAILRTVKGGKTRKGKDIVDEKLENIPEGLNLHQRMVLRALDFLNLDKPADAQVECLRWIARQIEGDHDEFGARTVDLILHPAVAGDLNVAEEIEQLTLSMNLLGHYLKSDLDAKEKTRCNQLIRRLGLRRALLRKDQAAASSDTLHTFANADTHVSRKVHKGVRTYVQYDVYEDLMDLAGGYMGEIMGHDTYPANPQAALAMLVYFIAEAEAYVRFLDGPATTIKQNADGKDFPPDHWAKRKEAIEKRLLKDLKNVKAKLEAEIKRAAEPAPAPAAPQPAPATPKAAPKAPTTRKFEFAKDANGSPFKSIRQRVERMQGFSKNLALFLGGVRSEDQMNIWETEDAISAVEEYLASKDDLPADQKRRLQDLYRKLALQLALLQAGPDDDIQDILKTYPELCVDAAFCTSNQDYAKHLAFEDLIQMAQQFNLSSLQPRPKEIKRALKACQGLEAITHEYYAFLEQNVATISKDDGTDLSQAYWDDVVRNIRAARSHLQAIQERLERLNTTLPPLPEHLLETNRKWAAENAGQKPWSAVSGNKLVQDSNDEMEPPAGAFPEAKPKKTKERKPKKGSSSALVRVSDASSSASERFSERDSVLAALRGCIIEEWASPRRMLYVDVCRNLDHIIAHLRAARIIDVAGVNKARLNECLEDAEMAPEFEAILAYIERLHNQMREMTDPERALVREHLLSQHHHGALTDLQAVADHLGVRGVQPADLPIVFDEPKPFEPPTTPPLDLSEPVEPNPLPHSAPASTAASTGFVASEWLTPGAGGTAGDSHAAESGPQYPTPYDVREAIWLMETHWNNESITDPEERSFAIFDCLGHYGFRQSLEAGTDFARECIEDEQTRSSLIKLRDDTERMLNEHDPEHTNRPAIYGAMREFIRLLDAAVAQYSVIPSVTLPTDTPSAAFSEPVAPASTVGGAGAGTGPEAPRTTYSPQEAADAIAALRFRTDPETAQEAAESAHLIVQTFSNCGLSLRLGHLTPLAHTCLQEERPRSQLQEFFIDARNLLHSFDELGDEEKNSIQGHEALFIRILRRIVDELAVEFTPASSSAATGGTDAGRETPRTGHTPQEVDAAIAGLYYNVNPGTAQEAADAARLIVSTLHQYGICDLAGNITAFAYTCAEDEQALLRLRHLRIDVRNMLEAYGRLPEEDRTGLDPHDTHVITLLRRVNGGIALIVDTDDFDLPPVAEPSLEEQRDRRIENATLFLAGFQITEWGVELNNADQLFTNKHRLEAAVRILNLLIDDGTANRDQLAEYAVDFALRRHLERLRYYLQRLNTERNNLLMDGTDDARLYEQRWILDAVDQAMGLENIRAVAHAMPATSESVPGASPGPEELPRSESVGGFPPEGPPEEPTGPEPEDEDPDSIERQLADALADLRIDTAPVNVWIVGRDADALMDFFERWDVYAGLHSNPNILRQYLNSPAVRTQLARVIAEAREMIRVYDEEMEAEDRERLHESHRNRILLLRETLGLLDDALLFGVGQNFAVEPDDMNYNLGAYHSNPDIPADDLDYSGAAAAAPAPAAAAAAPVAPTVASVPDKGWNSVNFTRQDKLEDRLQKLSENVSPTRRWYAQKMRDLLAGNSDSSSGGASTSA